MSKLPVILWWIIGLIPWLVMPPADTKSVIRVGVSQDPPLAFVNENGVAQGFYIDLLDDIASKEGWNLQYVPCVWSQCLSQLQADKLDLLVAIAYTKDRHEIFDFNQETVISNWGVIYLPWHSTIQSVLDLDGKTIAIVPSDIYAERLKQMLTDFDVSAEFVSVDTYAQVLEQTALRQVDAGVVNHFYAMKNRSHYHVEPSGILFNPTELRFAAPQGQQQVLLNTLDQYLRTYKKDHSSSYYQSLNEWMGTTINTKEVLPDWLRWTLTGFVVALLLTLSASFFLWRRLHVKTLALLDRNRRLHDEVLRRQQAEAALILSEAKYRAVFESSPGAIILLDLNGIILDCNKTTTSIMGVECKNLRGNSLASLPFTSEQTSRIWPDLLKRQPEELTGVQILRGGTEKRILVIKPTLLQWGGESPVMQLLVHDVTEARLAEQRLYERASRLELISKIMRQTTAILEVDELLAKATQLIGETFHYHNVNILLVEDDSLRLRATTSELLRPMIHDISFPIDETSLSGWVTLHNQPVMVQDVTQDPRYYEVLSTISTRSELVVPLRVKHSVIGVLDVQGQEVNEFSDLDMFTLQTIADQLAIVIENARLYKEARRELNERRRAEVALQTSEQRFRTMLNELNDALFIHEPETGAILNVNTRACSLYGYSYEELLQLNVENISSGVSPYTQVDALSWMVKAKKGQPQTFEWHAKNKSGHLFWVEVNMRYAVIGDEGQILATVRDITERRKAAKEREAMLRVLARRSTQLRTAAEVAKSAITILDTEKLMQHTVNLIQQQFDFYYVGIFLVDEDEEYVVLRAGTGEAGQRMLAEGHKLAIGTGMIGWSVKHAQARIALDVGEDAVRFDNPHLPKTRSEMALPLILRGKVLGALTVQSEEATAFTEEDITVLQAMVDQLAIALENARLFEEQQKFSEKLERRVIERTAQLEATNKELEAFAYSVSHDLRAPLRSIDGFSLALLEDYHDMLDDIGKDYLRRVRAASQRMGQLIDGMLKLSRLTRDELRRQQVNLSSIAEEIIAELQQNEPERDVDIIIEPNLIVNGDPRLLRAVLENLLGNAWKFTGKREQARIKVGVTHSENYPIYYVKDNGAGFDMAYADKLFGAFQRLHRTTEFQGNGIGLATVQRIIHRHGGKVWAEGEVGKGATFYFTLDSVA